MPWDNHQVGTNELGVLGHSPHRITGQDDRAQAQPVHVDGIHEGRQLGARRFIGGLSARSSSADMGDVKLRIVPAGEFRGV
jgi:hypothetical protein